MFISKFISKRRAKGSALLIAMVVVMSMSSLIVLMFNQTLIQSKTLEDKQDSTKALRVASMVMDIAIEQLINSTDLTSPTTGTGAWAVTDDTNGNGYPDFNEVADTDPEQIGDTQYMVYANDLGADDLVQIFTIARHKGSSVVLEATVEAILAPPDRLNPENPEEIKGSAGATYNNDLELNITISGAYGGINSNGSVRLFSGKASTSQAIIDENHSSYNGHDIPMVEAEVFADHYQSDLDGFFAADGNVYTDKSQTTTLDTSGSYDGFTWDGSGWSGAPATTDMVYYFGTDVMIRD